MDFSFSATSDSSARTSETSAFAPDCADAGLATCADSVNDRHAAIMNLLVTLNSSLVTLHSSLLFRILLGRVELVFAGLCAEALVVVELARLVDAHPREEEDARRGVDLREARQPDAPGQPRLLEDEGRARLDGGDEAAAHLEAVNEPRFQAHHVALGRVNPDNSAPPRDDGLARVRRT